MIILDTWNKPKGVQDGTEKSRGTDYFYLSEDSYYSFAEYGVLNGKRCELRATKLEPRGK